jgi:glycosyltransferase involved in cell wall biosynthesis
MVGVERTRIALIGPVPPPSGGMANQTKQLKRLLESSSAAVDFVPTNPPYVPAWIGGVVGLRAVARLLPYIAALARSAGRVDVAHVMASSGWAWHLFAAPAVWIYSRRGVPVVVNYRGGGAEAFFDRSWAWVRPTMARAAAVVVPSAFLVRAFAARGVDTVVVPNVIDRGRFAPPASTRPLPAAPHLVVARNLEEIYDVGTAIRAAAIVQRALPGTRLSIAGIGPEREGLETLARELLVPDSVTFLGRVENDRMGELLGGAEAVLNPSLVDNMPISILEALASGVPVVSTDAGGIPDLVTHDVHALLVPPRSPEAMAAAVLALHGDAALRNRLIEEGLRHVEQFTWERVGPRWLEVYATMRDTGAPRPGRRT